MVEESERVQLVSMYTRVLLQLAHHPRISQETLARKLDVTMRTAQRHLTELEEEGYVRVDRATKPFHYTIDWTKSVPYAPWMRLVLFHPGLQGPVSDISELAFETVLKAQDEDLDESEALRKAFSRHPTGAGTR